MTAFTRLRVLHVVLALVLLGGAAWLAAEDRTGEAVGLLVLGLLRERHAVRAYLSGLRAGRFERQGARTRFLRIGVPGGWTYTIQEDDPLYTIRLEGHDAWVRATWITHARDGKPVELASQVLEELRKTFRFADERTISQDLAGLSAEGVEATLSTWRLLGRARSVVARGHGDAAVLVWAYWSWGVPDDVIDRVFASVEVNAGA